MHTVSLLNASLFPYAARRLNGHFDGRAVDAFFDELFGAERAPQRDAPVTRPMPLEVSETDTAYHVTAELPGFKKEEITVKIDGANVTISAMRQGTSEAKPAVTAARSFRLAGEIDQTQAQAKVVDGVLELTLPKKVSEAAKVLTIH